MTVPYNPIFKVRFIVLISTFIILLNSCITDQTLNKNKERSLNPPNNATPIWHDQELPKRNGSRENYQDHFFSFSEKKLNSIPGNLIEKFKDPRQAFEAYCRFGDIKLARDNGFGLFFSSKTLFNYKIINHELRQFKVPLKTPVKNKSKMGFEDHIETLFEEQFVRLKNLIPYATLLNETLSGKKILIRVGKLKKQSLTISWIDVTNKSSKEISQLAQKSIEQGQRQRTLEKLSITKNKQPQKRLQPNRKQEILTPFQTYKIIIMRKSKLDLKKLASYLENGGDPNLTEPDTQLSLLHYAAIRKFFEACDLLLKYGANPSEPNKYGLSPVQMVSRRLYSNDKQDLKLLRLLQSKATKAHSLIAAVETGRADWVIDFIDNGAEVNQEDQISNQRFTPLHHAAKLNHPNICKILIENGADILKRTKTGNPSTALMLAARRGNKEAVLALTDQKLIPKNQDYLDEALEKIISRGEIEICELLMSRGARPRVTGLNDKRINHHFHRVINYRAKAITWYEKYGHKIPLWAYCAHGILQKIKNYPDLSELNQLSPLGLPPLSHAIRSLNHGMSPNGDKNLKTVKLLVELGADVNQESSKSYQKFTPLHFAVQSKGTEITKHLIEMGAKINVKGQTTGRTPLYIAVAKRDMGIIKLLIENGADPDLTPRIWNIATYSNEVLNLLKKNKN